MVDSRRREPRARSGISSSGGGPDDDGAADPVVDVFSYREYHSFVRDWIDEKRRSKPTYSFQQLANRAGLKSRSFLRLVTIGERNLLHAAAARLAEAMGLEEREQEFFLALVGFNNASDPWERDLYLRKLQGARRPAKRKILTAGEFQIFSRWYVIPIWELVVARPFGGDFKRLGRLLDPPVGQQEAREALDILLELRLIEPSGDRYRRNELVLHTRDELVSRTIKLYQSETIDLAKLALERVPPDFRNIGTMTIGIDLQGWARLKDLVAEFKQKLIDLASEIEGVDRVYQVNFQAFPLTSLLAASLESDPDNQANSEANKDDQ